MNNACLVLRTWWRFGLSIQSNQEKKLYDSEARKCTLRSSHHVSNISTKGTIWNTAESRRSYTVPRVTQILKNTRLKKKSSHPSPTRFTILSICSSYMSTFKLPDNLYRSALESVSKVDWSALNIFELMSKLGRTWAHVWTDALLWVSQQHSASCLKINDQFSHHFVEIQHNLFRKNGVAFCVPACPVQIRLGMCWRADFHQRLRQPMRQSARWEVVGTDSIPREGHVLRERHYHRHAWESYTILTRSFQMPVPVPNWIMREQQA